MTEVDPEASDTNVGIVKSELLVVNCTFRVWLRARVNVTLQVLELPGFSEVGLQLTLEIAGEVVTSREAVWDAAFSAAVTVTVEVVARPLAAAVKVADMAAAGTFTVAGTVSIE